jgi:hypothetical protein
MEWPDATVTVASGGASTVHKSVFSGIRQP